MRFHSAHIDNLRKLYVDQIEHLLSVENQIMEALPKMGAAAPDPELKIVLAGTFAGNTRAGFRGGSK